MHYLFRSLFIRLIIMLISVSMAACQRPTEALPEDQTVPGISIAITGDACPSLIVKAGDEVGWTNQDDQEHLIRVETLDGQLVFEANGLQPGDSTSLAFPIAGNYAYACTLEGEITGSITVEP